MLLLSLALAVAATDSLHPAPAPALGSLQPLLGTFHITMDQRSSPDSIWQTLGTATISRTRAGGRITNVAHYRWTSGKETIDTTIALESSLAPISERTITPSRVVRYDFSGLQSTGQIGPLDALKPIDDTLPQPAFNSTDFDMLMTALPLTDHYQLSLPIYDPEFPGFRMAAVKVERIEHSAMTVTMKGAWLVSVTERGHPPMYYHIDIATRRMLQKDFGVPGKTEFRVRETKS